MKQTITGVILAGGLARRMQQQDKGLMPFNHQAMIQYALYALAPVVDTLFINANRHIADYQAFNYPVISDEHPDFSGPLAGIYAALQHCQDTKLLVIPCDSPFITTQCLQHLVAQHTEQQADIAVAFDGQRIHPVFLVVRSALKKNLQQFLAQGQRKIDVWLAQHHTIQVDFSDTPEIFNNINTPEQLKALSS